MKGQWFLVSAVFVAFSMFAISSNLRGFRLLDASSVAAYNEEYHFANLKEGLQRTVELSDCTDMQENLDDYIYFSQQSNARRGYVADVFYDIEDCFSKRVRFDLIALQSERYQIWDGIRPQLP